MQHRAGHGYEDDDHLSARDEVRGAVDRSVRRSRRGGGRRAWRAGRATFAVLSLTHNYKVIAREAPRAEMQASVGGPWPRSRRDPRDEKCSLRDRTLHLSSEQCVGDVVDGSDDELPISNSSWHTARIPTGGEGTLRWGGDKHRGVTDSDGAIHRAAGGRPAAPAAQDSQDTR